MSFIRAKSYDAVAGFEPFWQEKIGGLIRWLKIPLWRASVTHGRTIRTRTKRRARRARPVSGARCTLAWRGGRAVTAGAIDF